MNSLLLLSALALAGPPKVDTLFPAGGQRGTTVDVVAGGTFDGPVQAWASHPGITIAPGKKPNQSTIAIAADVPTGIHWIRFHDKSGASIARPFLVNQVPEIQETEPNDDFRMPQTIQQPTVIVNGRLAKNDDVDTFAVTLKKGETLVAALEAHQTLRSPMDGVLQILSADGFVLAQNDDHAGFDPLLAFTAPKDGVHLVRLFCFPATPDSRVGFFGKETCIYRLTLTTGPYADMTWPLAVDKSNPGEVELIGWNIPADRKRVAVPKDVDHAFLQPEGFASGASVRGFSFKAIAVEGPASVTAPVAVSLRLPKPGAMVPLALTSKKGDRLSVHLESRERHSPVDPVMTLRKAGTLVKKTQSAKLNVDPSLDIVAADDSPLSLEIRDLFDGGGPRHVLLANIRPTSPDFAAHATLDRFTMAAGKSIEIPLEIENRHGFKGPLEVRAVGLPDSAKIEVITGKDAKKATLRITGIEESGPFRLYARGKDIAERPLTAEMAEWGEPMPWFWATVGAAAI